jgi:hypothetical protein
LPTDNAQQSTIISFYLHGFVVGGQVFDALVLVSLVSAVTEAVVEVVSVLELIVVVIVSGTVGAIRTK